MQFGCNKRMYSSENSSSYTPFLNVRDHKPLSVSETPCTSVRTSGSEALRVINVSLDAGYLHAPARLTRRNPMIITGRRLSKTKSRSVLADEEKSSCF
jgi:hypothetical protein